MRVLVTGATGYIGSRLIPALLAADHDVVATARHPEDLDRFAWAGDVERRRLDIEDTVSVHLAIRDVEAVFYLVHSMGAGAFVRRDRDAAEYVVDATAYADVGRTIYLSGLFPEGEDVADLSAHLASRHEVEQILLEGATPATVLRASMVIGAGSMSFEVLRRVSERLPVSGMPANLDSRIQPIAVADVVALLTAALDGPPRNRSYDVGGDDVVSYTELLDRFVSASGLVRTRVPLPPSPAPLVGEAVAALTGIPRSTIKALVESLRHDMVCADDDVRRELLPGHVYLGVDEAIRRSLRGGDDADTPGGDVQGSTPADPAWAGSTLD